MLGVKLLIFSYTSILHVTYVLGVQKNRRIENPQQIMVENYFWYALLTKDRIY